MGRTLFGRTFYRIRTCRGALVALCSAPEYEQHQEQYLPQRRDSKPGQKLLCYTHLQCDSSMLVPLDVATAKVAKTTVQSLYKAYPSGWYVVSDKGVFVQFPDAIRYGADLPEFEYCKGAA